MSKSVVIVIGVLLSVVAVIAGIFLLLPKGNNPTPVPNKYQVTIQSGSSEYGVVDITSVADVVEGTAVVVDGNKVTINGTTITATPTEGNAQYDYRFTGWTKTPTITKDTTIVANFERNVKTYTVSLQTNSVDSEYGADGYFDELSVVVPYGTVVTSSGDTVNFTYNSQVIESLRAIGNESCFGVSSISIESQTITGPSSVTANFVVKSDDDYDWLAFSIDALAVSAKLKAGQSPSVANIPRLVKIDSTVYTSKVIEENAFKDLTSLTTLIVPTSVESIMANAFSGCSNLVNVTLNNGLKSIGSSAFFGTKISAITIPSSVTSLGVSVFEECSNLVNVTFVNGSQIAEISDRLFYKCRYLRPFSIPATVTSLGDSAFSHCTYYLTSVVVPKAVTEIGSYCFEFASNLSSVLFEQDSNLAVIGTRAFAGLSRLESISIPSGVTAFNTETFAGCESLQSFTFAEGITTIPIRFFKDCRALQSVAMSSTITTINEGAFRGCTSLISFDIPAGVTILGSSDASKDSPFDGCSNLATVTFKQGSLLTTLNESVFKGVTYVRNIIFENESHLSTIPSRAFAGCTNLEVLDLSKTLISAVPEQMCYSSVTNKNCPNLSTVLLPNGVTSIGAYAFTSSGLTTISLPQNLESIGSYAFWSSRLTTIGFAENGSLETLGDCCFAATQIVSVEIPASVRTMSGCFYSCQYLQNVTFEAGSQIETIGDVNTGGALFRDCVRLQTVEFPVGCTIIPYEACSGCYNLRHVTIPEGYTTISSLAFSNCRSLLKVTLPSTIANIYGNDAFRNCYRLVEVVNKSSLSITAGSSSNGYVGYWAKQVINNEESSKLTTLGDFVYYVNGLDCVLIDFIGSSTTPTISEECTEINQYAFYSRGITGLEIPNGVTKIGKCAFTYCSSLTSITIPSSVATIETLNDEMQQTFYGCWYLTTVIIKSQAIYSGATSLTAYGLLLNYATTVKVLDSITGTNLYLNNPSNYSMVVEGDYRVYTKV